MELLSINRHETVYFFVLITFNEYNYSGIKWSVEMYYCMGGVYSMERNDGLNHGTERFLKLKL